MIQAKTFQLLPVALNKTEEAFTGFLYTSKNTYTQLKQKYNVQGDLFILINGYVFQLQGEYGYKDDSIAGSKYVRQLLRMSFTDKIDVALFTVPKDKEYRLGVFDIELDIVQQQGSLDRVELNSEDLAPFLKRAYNGQFFRAGQIQLFLYEGNTYLFKVTRTDVLSVGVESQQVKFMGGGMLVDETEIEFSIRQGVNQLKMKNASTHTASIFREDFSFDKLGVGGLDKELANIFRRAFSSRRFPQAFLEKYGIKHVKGLLLYGPPGTGKTLIARQLAKVLKARPPKIVNGPEIFSKFVGEAEENVRKLFAEAIADQETQGDQSDLHIIVFDEMDAICKQRGSINSGSGAYDNVVNQLLSMIDGVNSLNNILVIGMTNRKDLIDEAVLRPGRFEVHIEVGLPDEQGRQQILNIHTESLKKNNALDKDVNLDELASITKNYTGAEIEAVVKSASSFAFQRMQNIFDFQKKLNKQDELKVKRSDFMNALDEVKPQFGIDSNKFDLLLKNRLIDFGDEFKKLQKILKNTIDQTRFGKNSQLNSVLLEGEQGSGKTSVAAWLAVECGFPYVKLISPETFIGLTEGAIINQMVRIFNDAYKSSLSCILIDNIERLIEYVDIGPRFSNAILQALLVLIKRLPDKSQCRILIIGTTSQYQIMKQLEVVSCFNVSFKVPNLVKPDEIKFVLTDYLTTSPQSQNKIQLSQQQEQQINMIASQIKDIPIKRLLMLLDMVSAQEKGLNIEEFMVCYTTVMMNHI
ncbi:unnamed protein product [Paramecium primaurelia]|uniref:Vesicle-fusing ATPase n=1 Tax=Paramecium primaurelia TaxID=5886 RepID=A0A8S1LFP9_PARPR|nr:unnamed protein product [Paramecium primaurelia]